METFKVTLTVTVPSDWIEENPDIPMTKSHLNALLREQVWMRVSDALEMRGLEWHAMLSVVKVQRKGKKSNESK